MHENVSKRFGRFVDEQGSVPAAALSWSPVEAALWADTNCALHPERGCKLTDNRDGFRGLGLRLWQRAPAPLPTAELYAKVKAAEQTAKSTRAFYNRLKKLGWTG